MNKSDLRTGMVVESADDLVGVVLLNTCNGNGIKWFYDSVQEKKINEYETLDAYADNLLNADGYEDQNIVKIYYPESEDDLTTMSVFDKKYVIWERKYNTNTDDIKEVTIVEIEEKFGCKVKIVG